MRSFILLLFSVLMLISFVSCFDNDEVSLGIIGGADGPTAILVTDGNNSTSFLVTENEITDNTLFEISGFFKEAEAVAAYFTGHGGSVTGENTEYEGTRYDKFADCSTYSELESAVRRYFAPEIADIMLSKTIGELPLFLEQDGELYRFGGYAAQYGHDDCDVVITGFEEKENNLLEIKAQISFNEYEEVVTTEHTYTCKITDDGTYRFADDYELPIVLIMNKVMAE